MNLRVTKRYVDKYTKKDTPVGTELKNVPAVRADDLIDAGVAVEIKAAKKTDTKQEG